MATFVSAMYSEGHFIKRDDGKKACKYCEQEYRAGTSTSVLKAHLSRCKQAPEDIKVKYQDQKPQDSKQALLAESGFCAPMSVPQIERTNQHLENLLLNQFLPFSLVGACNKAASAVRTP